MHRNGQLWHSVLLQSVDFTKKECVLQDGSIFIYDYPIVNMCNLYDSLGYGESSYSA